MKDESILDVLFLSEKRRQILLFLLIGPKTIDDIKTHLNSKSSPIMVQIRILIRNFLIQEKNGVFSLTPLGSYTVREMKYILDMFMIFDTAPEYWAEADFSALPPHLINRIGELGETKLYYPDKAHIFDRTALVEQNLGKVESLIEISSIFRKEYISDFLYLAEQEIAVSFILTQIVIDRLANDYPEVYYKYMRFNNVRFFVCPEIKLASCTITDKFIAMSFFNKGGYFFNHDLVTFDREAKEWGSQMFHHFRSRSTIHQLQE
ncbi:MAG: winged helix-turn-helix domain-containing protein [Methanimicrococcus sp.]|nr:winged helix-turn-helix domain-containing protein [Methanimicrococcus sp.]